MAILCPVLRSMAFRVTQYGDSSSYVVPSNVVCRLDASRAWALGTVSNPMALQPTSPSDVTYRQGSILKGVLPRGSGHPIFENSSKSFKDMFFGCWVLGRSGLGCHIWIRGFSSFAGVTDICGFWIQKPCLSWLYGTRDLGGWALLGFRSLGLQVCKRISTSG